MQIVKMSGRLNYQDGKNFRKVKIPERSKCQEDKNLRKANISGWSSW